jgi:hypothetical protein
MHLYKNKGGKSKVFRYNIEKDAVTIRFTDASVYRYTNQSATPGNIAKMKELALAGKGLGTFIETTVKDNYCRKVR